jgi:hypothetical protein
VRARELPGRGGDQKMSSVNFWNRVRYRTDGLSVSTSGLARRGQAEIRVSVNSSELLKDAEGFLRFVVKYLENENQRVTPNQTLNYGYWLVKFEPTTDGTLDVWEYDPEFREFQHGGSLAIQYWRDQRAVCEKFHAAFDPPNPGKLTSVSAGVLEGRPVQAVRYNFGDPMSGWLIVTEQYDGDINSLKNHHTYHVTAARPDLAKFLALPCGFRFDQTDGEKAWFDPEAAAMQVP